MQLKLRPVPFVISLVISATVLFGGWFLYHSYAMENPLHELVGNQAGVESVTTEIGNEQVIVNLKLNQEASLREIYADILRNGGSILGDRTVKLNITNQPSPELEKLWSSLLFNIAEAMEQQQYSSIPELLDTAATQHAGLKYTAEMDETFVYIELVQGEYSKYVMLPRVPAAIGVWPNE
jgi:hypothetical protein